MQISSSILDSFIFIAVSLYYFKIKYISRKKLYIILCYFLKKKLDALIKTLLSSISLFITLVSISDGILSKVIIVLICLLILIISSLAFIYLGIKL